VLAAEGQRAVQVELGQHPPAVGHLAQRQARQALGQGLGLGAAMGFDHADGQRRAAGPGRLGGDQHGVGLAHARAGAEEDLQPAAPGLGLVGLDPAQQGVGVGPGVVRHHRVRSGAAGAGAGMG
jgi:hypothetical protein